MAGVFKIGVVSQKTGLSASTLRLWEDQYGLVAPARTRGGTRLYSESDLERILTVRQLVRERGYALDAIAEIIDEANARLPYTLDRVAIENLYLRDATNHAELEEGRRMARVQATVRSLVRAESAEQAANTLVAGLLALTGANSGGLGLYHRKSQTLVPVVTARGGSIGVSSQPPLPIAKFPREWQEAIDAREPYADHDLLRLDLPVEVSSRVIEDRTRSFHAEPLSIADEMVGVLSIASPRPRGIGREAERVVAELATAAGPAIHYFAHQFESAPLSEPRL
jgi:MerR family transcriptional regulator, heat shock protein HspR